MAQPRLKARFFVDPSGEVIEKARPLTRSQCRNIYERDGGVCQQCNKSVSFFARAFVFPWDNSASVDHIFPRSRGGQNTPENLRLLCKSCNSSKGAK